MTEAKLSAIDTGFGGVKARANNTRFNYPAIIGDFEEIKYTSGMEGKEGSLLHMAYEVNGRKYFVGEMARRQTTPRATIDPAERFLGDEGMVLLLATLAEQFGPGPHIINLVAGLPVNEFKSLKDPYREKLLGLHTIKRLNPDGSTKACYFFDIQEAWIMPQPWGAIFNKLLSDKGTVENPLYGTGKIGVVDWGYYSFDLAGAEELEFITSLSTSFGDIGLHTVYQDLAARIYEEYGVEIATEKLDSVVEARLINIHGTPKDITPLLEDSLGRGVGRAVSRIKSRWPRAWEFDKVEIVGGGADLLGSSLASVFSPDQAELSPRGIYCNVDGYWKYGLWQISKLEKTTGEGIEEA